MINILLFGPPGSGKGTQAVKLAEEFELKHISTGDVFRENIKNKTFLGEKANEYMKKGELVPDNITIGMLKDQINLFKHNKGFIFDGFPRTRNQTEELIKLLAEDNQEVSLMLSLEVEKEELVKRLLDRGKLSGRADDSNQDVINNRIKVYQKQTAEVADYFKKEDKYVAIDGVGCIADITENIKQVIRKRLML